MPFHLVGVLCWTYEDFINFLDGLWRKVEKNAQKIDENVKLYDLIELRPDIWLQIWIFWEILV